MSWQHKRQRKRLSESWRINAAGVAGVASAAVGGGFGAVGGENGVSYGIGSHNSWRHGNVIYMSLAGKKKKKKKKKAGSSISNANSWRYR